MRNVTIDSLVLAVLLAGAALVDGRQPEPTTARQPTEAEKKAEPKKSALEEMLEQALRNNPDIHVAEAKLREAEAELNRTRLLVAQKVVALHANRDAARATLANAEARFKRLQELHKRGTIALEEMENAAAVLQQAKADLAKIESELPYLTGKPPADAAVAKGLLWLGRQQDRAAQEEVARANELLARAHYAQAIALAQRAFEEGAKGPEADKIRAALDKPITLNIEGKSYTEALGLLVKEAPKDLIFQLKGNARGDTFREEGRMFAKLQNVPLGAALEYFEDGLPDGAFYVRDYGILLVTGGQRPPVGAVPVREFWKGGKTEGKEKKSP